MKDPGQRGASICKPTFLLMFRFARFSCTTDEVGRRCDTIINFLHQSASPYGTSHLLHDLMARNTCVIILLPCPLHKHFGLITKPRAARNGWDVWNENEGLPPWMSAALAFWARKEISPFNAGPGSWSPRLCFVAQYRLGILFRPIQYVQSGAPAVLPCVTRTHLRAFGCSCSRLGQEPRSFGGESDALRARTRTSASTQATSESSRSFSASSFAVRTREGLSALVYRRGESLPGATRPRGP